MINKELLDILVCPETRQEVALADTTLIDGLNQRIASGTLKNRGGEKVTEKMDAGLVRRDGRLLYPIRQDIPIMLIEEAIPLDE